MLVAVAIVSIALLAALRAAGQGTNNAGELRSRLLAGWVAENLLAEHRARGDWLPLGISAARAARAASSSRGAKRSPRCRTRRSGGWMCCYAAPDESRSLARLTGFVVRPPGERAGT